MSDITRYLDLIEQLKTQGWEVIEGNNSELVTVVPGIGSVHCVDGRKGNMSEDVMRGPKIQGSVYGVAALGVKGGTREAFGEAIEWIKQSGFVPSLHGDEHKKVAGCGFAGKWAADLLPNLPKLQVTPDEVREMVESAGGSYIELEGDHAEKVVRINFISDMTHTPDEGGFNLDVWYAEKVGIDTSLLLTNAVTTVVALNGPKVIEVYK